MHETPNRRCGQRSEGLGYKVPAGVDIAACRGDVLGLKPQCDIWRHSITAHVIVTTLSFLSTWCWQLAPTALNGIRQKSNGFCKAGLGCASGPAQFYRRVDRTNQHSRCDAILARRTVRRVRDAIVSDYLATRLRRRQIERTTRLAELMTNRTIGTSANTIPASAKALAASSQVIAGSPPMLVLHTSSTPPILVMNCPPVRRATNLAMPMSATLHTGKSP